MSDNTKKAQCIHCLRFFSKDSNSTLKNHITHPHCEAKKRVTESRQSFMSRDGSIFVYNPDVLREQFAGLVIQRGLPFNHFDGEQTTRVFQNHLQPRYTHIVFMTTKLTEYKFEKGIFATMVKPMKEKLKKYFERMLPIITCATALNSCFNIHGVEFLIESISTDLEFFDDSYATKAKKWFTDSFEGKGNNVSRSIPQFETFDVLGFWKVKETMFPVLSRMAMDILSVQATSVASESTFSTSGRVLSIRRTRLTPASLEMCMCLKDHLDTQERKQDKSTLETPVDFEEEILDADVQANEAIPLSDEEIALDAASTEGSMSGPGSGGEEAEAEANYGYGVYHDDY
ncbi:zinc finger BED domain-containing protein RICESLEEPER 2-like protein [Tanacetum coccineum]